MLVRKLIRVVSKLPVRGHGGSVSVMDGEALEEKEVEANSLEEGVEEAFGLKVERIKNLDNELGDGEIYYEVKIRPGVMHSNYFREIDT